METDPPATADHSADQTPAKIEMSHHDVFRRPGVFAGWPANYGV